MVMNRVLCTIVLVVGVLALVADVQTATALPKLDSSAFSWGYEMDAEPTTQDLDSSTYPGVDFYDYYSGGSLSGGIKTMAATETYASRVELVPGAVWQNISFASGYTIEARLKSAQASGYNASVAILGMAQTSTGGELLVGDDKQYWGEVGQPGYVALGSANNASDFHVFRIAQLPNEDSFSVWRDGHLLGESLTAGATSAGVPIVFYLGGAVTGDASGATQVDYIRLTAGAYAPTPEPTTFALLVTGMIGLLAYAWRKRK
jgi:hypothetical protein